MPVVYACRGPLAGRRVEIPDEEFEAAVADDGWALRLDRDGVVLFTDPSAVSNPAWTIPGMPIKPGRPVVKKFVHPPAAEKRSHRKK